jgi:hydrogenase maturation protein HypF
MLYTSKHIHINGIVQGVGFRPFIYSLANKHQLHGWVRNSASGVDIEITGSVIAVDEFIASIPEIAPPLAVIDSLEAHDIAQTYRDGFKIIPSQDKSTDFIPISPDVATCEQCKAELFDPKDRRYRYPFTNCTNCGPRFTIIKKIPYDRPKTTMAQFKMCPDCKSEYEDPLDRRFHAQPVACPVCGPKVWLENPSGAKTKVENEAIKEARLMLKEGKILAIKGLGGFHLACDAANPNAVERMRQHKARKHKPFALMAFNLNQIEKFVRVSEKAAELLSKPQAPIVLLPKKDKSYIAANVAPGQSTLGFMLPYTPLHLLLLEPAENFPEAFVMTSGNLSDEPIAYQSQTAREKLFGIVDAFLMHDRPIETRIDDSVFSIINGQPYPFRRARGYAPNPIRLPDAVPQVLAVGPQMKNSFCLTRDKYAFLSHYIGEMDNWETVQDYHKAVQHYEKLFRIKPKAIGYDLHPDYISTKIAHQRASTEDLPAYAIQHHYAHLIACQIENKIPPDQNITGLIFDGTGYGTDGTIWGGEVLVGNVTSFQRLYHLKYVPLPGGDAAILKPARMALSTLWGYDLPWEPHLAPLKHLSSIELNALENQLEKGVNTAMTSSMGRLFDAVSALIGIRQEITYEAQAAMELEAIVNPAELGYYPVQIIGENIDIKPMLQSILQDIAQKEAPSNIAARFHNTIANLSLDMALRIRQSFQINQIALSGGVWQNMILLKKTFSLLESKGFEVLIHKLTPPNDGCVALGQAINTAYRFLQDKE